MRALARINRTHLLALIALVLGIGLCAGTLVRAVRVDAAPAAMAGADSLHVPDVPARGESGGDVAIEAAVDVDPFHPARTRPGARYVPGGLAPAATPGLSAPQRVPIPMLRLLGIVSKPNGGGLAAVSVNGRPARIVRVGETIEGLRLTRIQAGAATLTRSDTTLVVRLPGAPGQP